MGKASKFFKSFFGFKPPESTHPPPSAPDQPKRRWSFFKSHKDKPLHNHHLSETFDPSLTRPRDTPRHHHFSDQTRDGDGCSANHAIAVAATTAVVVEASEATAHASVEVVGMTSRTTGVNADYGLPGEWAAVKIQSYFRAYLSRKALRALKALVKLQALVRGTLTRKQTADNLRRLQALVRAQARARARRLQMADSPHSITKFASYIHQNGPPTPEKFEHVVRSRVTKQNQPSILKNNGSRMYDEKILEIDTTKSHLRRRNLFQPDQISYSQSQSLTTSRGSTIQPPGLSPSESYEVNSITAQNSPPYYPVSSKGNMSMRVDPFTPTKSDGSRSCVSGQMDHPNYMANTESSRAKARSLSAPRQRPQIEFSSTTKRYSVYGYGLGATRGSNLRDSFVSKAYPGSGRLDRLGMPVGFRESDHFSGGYWN